MREETKKERIKRFVSGGIWGCIILGSFVLRMINLNMPLFIEPYSERQSMVAIIVQNFCNDGVNLLNYKVPVMGYPWTIPMEFPIFEVIAYLLSCFLGMNNIDLICRILNIISFYFVVIALNLILKRFLKPISQKIILVAFLFAPYNIFWSRMSMIDYMSVAFGLFYVHLMLRWYCDKMGKGHYFGALLCGGLGYLCKSTSMIPIVLFLSVVLIYETLEKCKKYTGRSLSNRVLHYIKSEVKELFSALILCVTPAFVGMIWTKYSDVVKAGNVITAGYTSSALKSWNFGTLEQKMDVNNWLTLFEIHSCFWPKVLLFLFLPFCIFFLLFSSSKREKAYVLASLFATIGTLFLLFNLYLVHHYYHMAIIPFSIVGIMLFPCKLVECICEAKSWKRSATLICLLFLVFMCGKEYEQYTGMLYYLDEDYIENTSVALADFESKKQLVLENVSMEENIIVCQQGWATDILFYTNRKGYSMKYIPEEYEVEMFKDNNFKYILLDNEMWFEWASENWKEVEFLGSVQQSGGNEWKLFELKD